MIMDECVLAAEPDHLLRRTEIQNDARRSNEYSHVAMRFVVSDSEKNARIQGWRFSAKIAPTPLTSPISTHAP